MNQVIFLSIQFYQGTPSRILYEKKNKIMLPLVTGVYRLN